MAHGDGLGPLPRTVRGKRPAFHEQASIDRLIAMLLALTGEVSVLRDRLATVEALGRRAGWLGEGVVEGYVPDLDERRAREAEREALISRVFAIVREELSDLEEGDADARYWQDVAAIERGDV